MSGRYLVNFKKHGAIRKNTGLKNEVWIDVGNALEPGCFDHHQIKGCDSALMAVTENLQYLDELKKCKENGEDIHVYIHECPDMDCIASYYVIRFYLEKTQKQFDDMFGVKGKARSLIQYVNDIDAGKNKVVHYPTLYAIMCSIGDGMERTPERDKYILEKGYTLISEVMERISRSEDINLVTCDLSQWIGEAYQEEIGRINKATYIYEEAKEKNIISFEKILLWTKSGELEEVPAAIWNEVPKDFNGYAYARAEGNVVTVVPYSIKGENGAATTRVFASINPDLDKEKKYTLKPIVEIVEQMEQMEEQRIYEHTGEYRRDHSRPRELTGHLGEVPFSVTSDPWFINGNEDLFDSPGMQSLLEYEDILAVIRNNGSQIKRCQLIRYSAETANDVYKNTLSDKLSMSKWQKDVSDKLKKKAEFHLLFTELDSSLIRHSNKILEAYCLNLVGRPYHECKDENFIHLDYKTCIYVDYKCMIILVATYKEESLSQMAIGEILNRDDILNSPLAKSVKNVIKQKSDLYSYGLKIGEFVKSNEAENEKAKKGRKKVNLSDLNDDLIEFSKRVQKEDMITNSTEKEIYDFLKNKYGIDSLKTALMDEVNILVNASRDRLLHKFNVLSAIAVPFVLIATFFQIGFIKLEEIIFFKGDNAVIAWGIVAIIVIILTAFVWKAGSGKRK